MNVTQLVFFYALANTEIMKKTQSQQIAAALDAAMSNYYGPGKMMSGAELGNCVLDKLIATNFHSRIDLSIHSRIVEPIVASNTNTRTNRR